MDLVRIGSQNCLPSPKEQLLLAPPLTKGGAGNSRAVGTGEEPIPTESQTGVEPIFGEYDWQHLQYVESQQQLTQMLMKKPGPSEPKVNKPENQKVIDNEEEDRYNNIEKAILHGLKLIARLYVGSDVREGHQFWNPPKVARHLAKGELWKVPSDKMVRKEIRTATIIFDTSGSCNDWIPVFKALAKDLKQLSFDLTICEGPNGFIRDDYDAEEYSVPYFRKDLGHCGKIRGPIAYNKGIELLRRSTLSFLFADFDGIDCWTRMIKDLGPYKLPFWIGLQGTDDEYSRDLIAASGEGQGGGYPMGRYIDINGGRNLRKISANFLFAMRNHKRPGLIPRFRASEQEEQEVQL